MVKSVIHGNLTVASMNLELEIGLVPPSIFDSLPDVNAVEALLGRANTAKAMKQAGASIEPSEKDKEQARELFITPRGQITPDVAASASEGTSLYLKALLDQYDFNLLETTQKIRNFIANRLIEEAAPDKKPREALKALDMLGKIGDIGMFVEHREVTIHQKGNSEIENALREKLEKYMGKLQEVQTVDLIEAPKEGDV